MENSCLGQDRHDDKYVLHTGGNIAGQICICMLAGLLFLGGCGLETVPEAPSIQSLAPETIEFPVFQEELESEETFSEPEPEVVTITISAVGDVTMGNYVGQIYTNSFREMYGLVDSKSYFFENVHDIFAQDDMTIVNLEGVLTYSDAMAPGRTYNIKGDPEYAAILTSGSVEAVSMANNHRLDFGEAATDDTVAAVKAEGIVYAYDKNLGIYETKGIRIGFVSVNALSQSREMEKMMEEGIASLQEQGADLILACCHWGTERENYPTDYQRKFGKQCIDWGADLVIGHHPHVLQGVEEYQGKYIIYSLANFCFGANRNPSDKDTMIAQQTFTFIDGEKQEDTVFGVIPCSVSSVKNRNDYKPTPAEGEEAERILGRINKYSEGFGVQFDEDGYVVGSEAEE